MIPSSLLLVLRKHLRTAGVLLNEAAEFCGVTPGQFARVVQELHVTEEVLRRVLSAVKLETRLGVQVTPQGRIAFDTRERTPCPKGD